MDDNKFDKRIKDKISNFDAVDFEPSHLAAFRNRMDAQHVAPWHVKYRSEMLVAAATTIIAILLLLGQQHIAHNNMNMLRNELVKNQKQSDELLSKIDHLTSKDYVNDTVRVVEYRNDNNLEYKKLLSKINSLKLKLDEVESNRQTTSYIGEGLNVDKKLIYLGRESDIPNGIINDLNKRGGLVKNGPYLFMLVDESNMIAVNDPYFRARKDIEDSYYLPEYEFVIDTLEQDENIIVGSSEKRIVQYSVKKLNKLERHYQKGIGIEMGPTIEMNRVNLNIDENTTDLAGGILANFITSPKFGFETGAIFHTNTYDVSFNKFSSLSLPEPDPELGNIEEAEIASWFIEIPLNVKYRSRISLNSHLIFGTGLSYLIYTKQQIEFKYTLAVDNNRSFPVESLFQKKNIRPDFGTVNLSAGISSKLNNGKKLETSLIYKKSIGSIGEEQVDSDFFGLRASYLFTLK